jgi:hypothetical protein
LVPSKPKTEQNIENEPGWRRLFRQGGKRRASDWTFARRFESVTINQLEGRYRFNRATMFSMV